MNSRPNPGASFRLPAFRALRMVISVEDPVKRAAALAEWWLQWTSTAHSLYSMDREALVQGKLSGAAEQAVTMAKRAALEAAVEAKGVCRVTEQDSFIQGAHLYLVDVAFILAEPLDLKEEKT